MKVGRAILAGIVGCIIALAIIGIAGSLWHTHADLCALFGDMLVGNRTGGGWLLGAAVQLVIAIIAALIYAAIFEWVTHRAGAWLGLLVAIPHVIIAGLAVGFVHVPSLAVGFGPPGAFMEYRGGWIIGAFILAHLVFGLIQGTMYGRTRHVVPRWVPVWRDVTLEG
jgi:hypothetical protein